MDNSDNLLTTEPISFQGTSDDSGFFSGLKSINLTTWLIVILILSFLGFNIFAYLAKGTQDITNIFAPLMKALFGTAIDITGKTVDVAAEGAKGVVGGAKAVVGGTALALNAGLSAVDTGLTAVQDITPDGATAKSSLPNQTVMQQPNTLNSQQGPSQTQNQGEDYEAHEASSSVHSAGKAGWCFIGDDRGFRSCAQVGVNDTCMSGDIFPSQQICINPNLRP